MDESVDTPGSVPCRRCQHHSDGHPSRPAIADRFQRPTRRLGRAALERLLSELAPGGVCRAAPVTWGAGGLLHHRFTLTAPPAEARHEAVCSLWHFPADHSGWVLATTLPCGARTFLGKILGETPRTLTRPPDRLIHRPDYRQTSVCRWPPELRPIRHQTAAPSSPHATGRGVYKIPCETRPYRPGCRCRRARPRRM